MKKYFLLLFISFYVGQNNSFGQDLKVGEKSYLISSKRQINSDVEFLKLKERSAKNSKVESFIRVNKVVSKTIFSEAEIKNFLTNGTVSSLGRVAEKKIKIKGKTLKLNYIKKGKVQVLFHIEKDKLQIREYDNDLEKYLAKSILEESDEDPANIAYRACIKACGDALVFCTLANEVCYWNCQACCDMCEDKLLNPENYTRPRPPLAYFIPIKNTAIKIN